MTKDFQHIILGVSASGPTKRWPVENYIKLAENLLKIYNCKFYLALGKNDNDIEQKIMNSEIKDACFSFSNIGIKETLADYQKCRPLCRKRYWFLAHKFSIKY